MNEHQEQIQIAPVEIRHVVYSALLKAMPLSDAHRKSLCNRGLSDEAIERNGYGTVHGNTIDLPDEYDSKPLTEEDYLSVPGFFRNRNGKLGLIPLQEGFLIPQRNLDGQIIALKVRLDYPGGGGKCLAVSSQNRKYECDGPSPGSPCHVPLGTPKKVDRVIIVEGELKADVASHLGLPTISFPGAQQWRVVLPVLQAMGCKTVDVAFDADHKTNPNVTGPMRECIRELRQHFDVNALVWENLDDKRKGLDDLLNLGYAPKTLHGDEALSYIEDVCKRLGVEELRANQGHADNPRLQSWKTDSATLGDAQTVDDEFQQLKRRIDFERIVNDVCGQPKGGKWFSPFCENKRKPTLSLYTRNGERKFRCWKSGAGGDVIQFVRDVYGLTFQQACERLGLPMPKKFASKRDTDDSADDSEDDPFQDIESGNLDSDCPKLSSTWGQESSIPISKPRQLETYQRPQMCSRSGGILGRHKHEPGAAAEIYPPCRKLDWPVLRADPGRGAGKEA